MAKGAMNLMKAGKPVKRTDAHASKPGMAFGKSNPDQGDKRIKVAKGLMIKH
jgi:hypothetical protein